ncbi:MAG: OmpA family protein [Cytophagales bacterium]
MSTLHAQKSNVNYDELKGVEYYNRGDIKDAIKFFEGLIKSDSSSAEHHFWLGKCYETTAQKDKELVHYLKARQLNPKISPDILYRIAKAYHQGFFFDDAIKYYKMYKKDINDAGAAAMKSSIMKEHIRASKRIHECENAKIMVANAYSHKIYHLSGVLNSEYPEYTPSVSADNKKMLFTSRRPGGTSEDKDKDNGNFEDVWMSVKDENGEWSSPQNVGSPVNTISHDACVSMDATGKELFLYKTSNGGDIYFSILENGNWSKPDALKQVNSKFKEPSVTISSNGRTIFFSSDRPGGFGGLDIYRTDKNKDGNWSEAENLGSVVNSEYDEDSPYISPDNKTLYFSSNGHNNMGGYDIFSAAYDVKKRFWGKPLNIGFPINSPDDDIYFAIAGDHRTAYFASEKKDGFGEKDIYMILIDSTYISKPLLSVDMGGVAPLHVASVHPSALKMHEGKYDSKSHAVPTNKAATDSKPNSPTAATAIAVASTIKGEVVEYRGRVLDENGQPIVSIIMVKNENSTEAAKSYKTQPDGTFVILLEKGFDYGIDIEKDGYIFSSNNIDLTKEAKVLPKLQEKIVLKKPTLGAKIILKNIAYASGSASLEPESFVEIDILSEFLVKNPTIKIEISGHTDNKGTAEVNKELSTARAKSVYKLLVKKGIIPERLKYVGYGSDRSIANNDTEAGRQLNRRTEFEIIYR